jgi:hypothetical protein
MAQANELQSEVFLRLREYKVDQKFCRYYTEWCEHGTLETLRLRYKAGSKPSTSFDCATFIMVDHANCSKYFPELFLWHIFHHLAHGYLEFVRGRWRSLTFLEFGGLIP